MNSISDDSRAADDVFANSSAETVMENIDFSFLLERANVLIGSNLNKNSDENKFGHVTTVKNSDLQEADSGTVTEAVQGENYVMKEVITADTSFVANCIAMNVCSFPLKHYCPFCCSNFTSESKLKGHIRNEHASQLGSVLVDNNTTLLHSCQLCHARFYTDDLLTKHVAEYHQDYVITMFQEEEPNKCIICGFCPYMVLIKHKQHLLAHVEEKHFEEFKLFIDQKFSKIAQCEKLQYTLDMKNSNIPNLNTLLMQMSIKENKDNKKGNIDQSECSSVAQFINQDQNQLPHEDGNFFDKRKISGIKNVGPGNELPIRRKLRFDVPDIPEFKNLNKENITSCNTNMKPVPKSSKLKPISTWKSVFSFRRNKMNRSKPISKFSTSTPNTFSSETHITKPQYDEHNLVTKKKDESKVKLISSIKEEKCTCKRYSVTDIHDAPKMHNKDMRTIISEESYPVLLEMAGDSIYRWTSSTERLKQFECAICLNGFVNNTDLLTHTKQQHSGPLKLLQPSYKCGQCAAKFYKNSYLVKHCRFHHTPRCLTNELPA
ncbi:hypothetical protein Cfor_04097 [Coptotermes formosanus]|uniref:C2H2-type domain-containing protein n=1 Tax=Coptotermes formosanus TaxID=36987 RepID=A0A6L2PM03_COPFO|nr:hypothetical protein Cfor_04097 [Coptotermes formosanus]